MKHQADWYSCLLPKIQHSKKGGGDAQTFNCSRNTPSEKNPSINDTNDSRRYGVKIIACELDFCEWGFCKLVVSSTACLRMLRFLGEERFSFIFKGEARYVAEFLNDIYIY